MDGTHARRKLRRYAALLLVLLATWALPAAHAQTDVRYFSETNHYLRGAFRFYWERNGGVPVFGFPITEEYVRRSDGRIVQYFERARFELATRGNQAIVELGLIGREVTTGRDFPRVPPVPSTSTRRYYSETGHTLRGAFKSNFDARGGVRIFGFPISEEFNETLGDGQSHIVQYFERARFELWATGVLFSQLGRILVPQQLLKPWPPNSPPSAPLSEDGKPEPPPFSGGAARVALDPPNGPAGTTFTVQGEGFQPGERVDMWLTVPGGSVRGLPNKPDADRNGSITGAKVQIPTDTGFRDGVWYVTAHGSKSGREGIGTFRIGGRIPGQGPAPNPLTVPLQDSLQVRGDGDIAPLAAPSGSLFTFAARGFDANERVGVWFTKPGGKTEEVASRLVKRDGGNATVVFRTDGFAEGVWTITAEGARTKRNVTAPFKLTRDYVAPLGTPRPGNRGGTVSPAEGGLRTAFRLSGSGFRANELLQLWITSPDGVYYFVGATERADSRGRVGVSPPQVVRFDAAPRAMPAQRLQSH
ncbi:MAG TPA: hypothetical protein VFX76_02970, partial [Roseiflexaceae bacterium]|nr:hypothetical protein [Roseiflexaceae bacterium]